MTYRIEYRKNDMRTKFCKANKEHIINPQKLIELIGKYNPTIKGDKIIMKNGKEAYEFFKEI